MRPEFRYLRTPGVWDTLQKPRQVTYTSTKVPRFEGTTSWEQYRQVFDAIVLSNGWDDVTAALQLLSHLAGDAPECGPVGSGAPASITGRIGGCVDRTLQFSGMTGGLPATI